MNEPIIFLDVVDVIVSVSNTIGLAPKLASDSAIILSNASNVLTSLPLARGKRKRAVSYKPRTEA